jgi:hypothetical protein
MNDAVKTTNTDCLCNFYQFRITDPLIVPVCKTRIHEVLWRPDCAGIVSAVCEFNGFHCSGNVRRAGADGLACDGGLVAAAPA